MSVKRSLKALALTLAMASATAFVSPASSAQPAEKFYIFGETVIDGTSRGPSVDLARSVKRPKFARLLSLKKELVPGIVAARKSRVFK